MVEDSLKFNIATKKKKKIHSKTSETIMVEDS